MRCGGSEEGDEGSDDENVDDDEGLEEGAAKINVEEISDASDEDDEGFTKLLPSPMLPTQNMIDLHNISHLPYASWCSTCVRGRGARYAHKMNKEGNDGIPVICCDYIINENYIATLIMIDRRSKWIFAYIVLHK